MTRVLVVGAGIGGLALAQGLVRRGVDVTVVERDAGASATGGYKLHLGPATVDALRELLPPDRFEAVVRAAVASERFTLVVRDHRGRRLVRASEAEAGTSLDVDRVTLRRLLADGLGPRLRWGWTATGFSVVGDEVEVACADGSSRTADVLVVADGAGSRLAAQLAGAPTSARTGLTGIAGRVPWTDVPPSTRELLGEPVLAVGPGGTGLFASAHAPPSGVVPPSVIWGFLALDRLVPDGTAAGEDARSVAASVLALLGWTGRFVELVERTPPATVGMFRLDAADPERLAPWAPGRVTALGDAVHAMPPTGGQGAATAIRDARDLVDAVSAVAAGAGTPAEAFPAYERVVRARGARAVRESVTPVRWIRRAGTPVGSVVLRGATPVVAGAAAVVARFCNE